MDKFDLARAKSNALTGQANYATQQAAQKGQMYSGIGAGVGQGIGAYGQYKNSNPTVDTDSNDDEDLGYSGTSSSGGTSSGRASPTNKQY